MRVRVRIGPRAYSIELQTSTELDVLCEVGLQDEYRLSDDIPAETVVDLGAHVGLATLRLLAAHPRAKVVAVEADPRLVARLRENVRGLPVTVVHAAVCDQIGMRPFYRSNTSSWGNSLTRGGSHQDAVSVPTTTLDRLLDSQGLADVDLLKIDVEGAEWDIFEGGVLPRISAIIGELHVRDGKPPTQLLEMISQEMDVKVISSDSRHATFVARRDRDQPNVD